MQTGRDTVYVTQKHAGIVKKPGSYQVTGAVQRDLLLGGGAAVFPFWDDMKFNY